MATLVRKKRLFNPARKHKRLSLRQKLFFGSKRQREAARASLKNSGRKRHSKRRTKRVSNIGEIFTIKLKNPSRRKRNISKVMAQRRHHVRRRRRNAPRPWAGIYERHYKTRKRRRNPESRARRRRAAKLGWRHRRHSNPMRSYRRRRNPSLVRHHRYHHRRHRNPIGADVSRTISIVAGAVVTKFISTQVAKFAPSLASGYMNWAVIGATAVAQGWVVKKVFKKPSLGDDMVIGGLVYLAIQVINSMFPSLSLSGLGYIGNSSFYVPQVPANGSMGKFLTPPAVSQAISAAAAQFNSQSGGAKGMGAVVPMPNNGSRTALRRGFRTA